MIRIPLSLRLAVPAAALLAAPLDGQRVERFTLDGSAAAVHNLAGEVTVQAGSGREVVVEVTRHGADAGDLRVSRGGDAVRVVYPGNRVVYPRMGARSRSTVQVRRDGTLGGGLRNARRVTVAGSGSGTRAYADVRVLVPAGRAVSVHQGVGEVRVSNVNGRVAVDGGATRVSTEGTRGGLRVDVGSGRVEVRNASSDVDVETGSGGITLENVRGASVRAETGSGGVRGSGIRAERVEVESGSGGVRLAGVDAPRVQVETGSGSVTVGLTRDADVEIETGSGGVTLTVPRSFGAVLAIDTGSGGIDVDLPVTDRRARRGEFSGRVGDGDGRVNIETGSGGVRIRGN